MTHEHPTPPAESAKDHEGQGGEAPSRAEARLIGRAVRERWKITEQARENAVRRLNMIVFDDKAGDRAHIGAVRALAALDRLNLESEQLEALRQIESRLDALEGGDEGTGEGPGSA